MLIAVERLLIRVRQPASRADELIALRARLRDELARTPDEQERRLAAEVLERKLAVAAALADVTSCATCATCASGPSGASGATGRSHGPAGQRAGAGHTRGAAALRATALPRARVAAEEAPAGFAGGACCGGNTAALFDDRELAALAHAGTRPRDLVPPAGDDAHAGCAFRGPRRCTLEVAHRPARCVHYVCATLRHEIRGSGAHADVQGKLAELQRAMQRFVSAHRDGVDRETLAPIVDAIAAARDA